MMSRAARESDSRVTELKCSYHVLFDTGGAASVGCAQGGAERKS